MVKNQESFAFMNALRKFKQYRRYYNELSKELVHVEALKALETYNKSHMYPDIVEMHIFVRAFHVKYRHKYAQMRINEEKK